MQKVLLNIATGVFVLLATATGAQAQDAKCPRRAIGVMITADNVDGHHVQPDTTQGIIGSFTLTNCTGESGVVIRTLRLETGYGVSSVNTPGPSVRPEFRTLVPYTPEHPTSGFGGRWEYPAWSLEENRWYDFVPPFSAMLVNGSTPLLIKADILRVQADSVWHYTAVKIFALSAQGYDSGKTVQLITRNGTRVSYLQPVVSQNLAVFYGKDNE